MSPQQFSLNSKTSVAWLRELSGAAVQGFDGRQGEPVDLQAASVYARLRALETWGTEKEDARALIVESLEVLESLVQSGATRDAQQLVGALDEAFKYLKPHLP